MDSARSAATDSASLALLLRLGHAALILFVLPIHHFGVVAGILICTVFSAVSFFVVSGVLEVLFHDIFPYRLWTHFSDRCLLLIAASLVLLVSVLPCLQSQMNLVVATIHLITCSL